MPNKILYTNPFVPRQAGVIPMMGRLVILIQTDEEYNYYRDTFNQGLVYRVEKGVTPRTRNDVETFYDYKRSDDE